MNAQMIRRLLYAFKRQWGTQLDYVQIVTSESDDRTGDRSIQRQVFCLPAVLLPQNQVRKFIQDIGYLAANKNFTYGGLNDFNKIAVLISKYDMPEGMNMDLLGYINHLGKRFERVSIANLYEEAFLLISQGVEGANPYSRIKATASNTLYMAQGVTVELN